MFQWNKEKLRFMEDAAAWGDFHARLAAALAPCRRMSPSIPTKQKSLCTAWAFFCHYRSENPKAILL